MARHLQDNHSNYTAVETSDVQEEECGSPKPDFKFNYHQNKLAFGLLLLDFNDAVREGDGEHLFYHSESHTKYAYIVLLHMVKVVAILPEFEAHRLKWNRFYNKYRGTVASWLVRSSPDRAVLVQALAGDIVLCSWARHLTLTVPLSTQVYKWVLANLMLGG